MARGMRCLLLGSCLLPGLAVAAGESGARMGEVVVTAPRIEEQLLLQATGKESGEILPLRAATSDAATLLQDQPGVSLYRGGGVSTLPVLHGLADDRVRINLDGREVPSACGNHMNPPLSYIDPSDVDKVDVMGGITPVSAGGDSIAGTITVQSANPRFASGSGETLTTGKFSAFNRSNGDNWGGNLAATIASDKLSLGVQASTTTARDYKDGHGRRVMSTAFSSDNYAVKIGARGEHQQLTLEVGGQDIPYQDFVNAQMDMVGNTARFVNARHESRFAWGKLDTQLHWQNTEHQMDVRGDKTLGRNMIMPMNTDGTNLGYLIKAEIDLSKRDTVRIGNEFNRFTLDDWWPASSSQSNSACNTGNPATSTCSMAPGTLWNIRDGQRSRLGTFLEWNARWDARWSTLLGGRNDIVWMNTGNVAGYNTNPAAAGMASYAGDAAAFNARDRAKQDVNFDMTALLRFEPDAASAYEGGYARKTRSPNLYERYLWIYSSAMSSRMNSQVGDANGYSGNINLEPEVAHTLSLTGAWHDPGRKNWEIKATPYFTRVQDFIDADRCSAANTTNSTACNAANANKTSGLVNLQYANHDAQLYGLDLSGRATLGSLTNIGSFGLSGKAGYVHGENLDSHDALYHLMPFNTTLTLEHTREAWKNSLEFQFVTPKERVSSTRDELKTGGYGLVNYRTGYQWSQVRLDAGVDNLLDQFYNAPLGGVYWVGDATGATPVPGMGRSFYLGLTVAF
ncbi:MAG: TonB-dependent receptor plug domain-containing protein [Magnetococcales bacterium]|nr:TonB-dependent receptor plug domain-containing protein [Magnetococcales bacterium]